MMVDTHSHVHFKAFDEDRKEVLKKCQEKGMLINAVGTQQSTSENAIKLAEEYDFVYASVGLHPIQEYKVPVKEEMDSFVTRGEEFDIEFYSKLAEHPKVIAVGETGLDRYHVPKDQSYDVIFETQKKAFLDHVEVASRHDLPLVVHVRDAHKEMLEVLDGLDKKVRGVVHCFTGNWEQAQRYLDHGFYLGFTGVITFPPKKNDPETQLSLLEVVEKIPLERMLVETDSPYLAPQEYRGKRCEPWMVEECIKKIAQIRGLSVEEVEKLTTNNALTLFNKIKRGI